MAERSRARFIAQNAAPRTLVWQREYLRLAATWLDCRLRGRPLWYGVLGELDYAFEMALILREERTRYEGRKPPNVNGRP